MQRIAFEMSIRPGTQDEYRRRHQQVWPDLLADLKAAGCHNYSIFLRDTRLLAYMEVDDFQRFLAHMAASEADKKWEDVMSDILQREVEADTGFPATFTEVFHLD
jgi:L-rhamnose mutarotase